MSVGTIRFEDGKWVARYKNFLLAKSTSKEHVINIIRNGRCNKANAHGVTDVQEIGAEMSMAASDDSSGTVELTQFSIGERFDFLTDYTNMVISRVAPSLIITGDGGLGKSWTVNTALQDANMVDASKYFESLPSEEETELEDTVRAVGLAGQANEYLFVKGYSTAKGLFRTLYENRNRILVFDDCDSILRDPTAVNLLKAALDSYDVRIVSWNSESFGDDLPRRFEFTGGIIFISNLPLNKIPQPLRSRSICVDVTMTPAQKIERMATISRCPTHMPNVSAEHKEAALQFIIEKQSIASELSMRALITVTRMVVLGGEWRRRAEYALVTM